jgi:hypothetical protein
MITVRWSVLGYNSPTSRFGNCNCRSVSHFQDEELTVTSGKLISHWILSLHLCCIYNALIKMITVRQCRVLMASLVCDPMHMPASTHGCNHFYCCKFKAISPCAVALRCSPQGGRTARCDRHIRVSVDRANALRVGASMCGS